MEYINPIILGICLAVGFVVKTAVPSIPNRFIPLIALINGLVISVAIQFPEIDGKVILSGMFSGLASTGMYEMLRNLLNGSSDKSAGGK